MKKYGVQIAKEAGEKWAVTYLEQKIPKGPYTVRKKPSGKIGRTKLPS